MSHILLRMEIDIYMPRLDVSFKKGIVPKKRGTVLEIRRYWKDFCFNLKEIYIKAGHNVRIIEIPLWQMTEELVKQYSNNTDIVFVPHKMKLNWLIDLRVYYYMQMVIPNIFSIDTEGWCASASVWPISNEKLKSYPDNEPYNILRRISKNTSKFAQPNNINYECPQSLYYSLARYPMMRLSGITVMLVLSSLWNHF